MADVLDLGMRALAYPVCWTILVNGLDDLFIDANYYLRGLYRDGERAITTQELKANEAKRIAMMVPAWAESEVIHKMLELNLEQLDYDHSDFDWQLRVWIGFSNDAGSQYFTGLIDGVTYTETALTQEQIASELITPVEVKGKLTTTWAGVKTNL